MTRFSGSLNKFAGKSKSSDLCRYQIVRCMIEYRGSVTLSNPIELGLTGVGNGRHRAVRQVAHPRIVSEGAELHLPVVH